MSHPTRVSGLSGHNRSEVGRDFQTQIGREKQVTVTRRFFEVSNFQHLFFGSRDGFSRSCD